MHAPVRTHTTPDAPLGLRPRYARATSGNSLLLGSFSPAFWGLKAKKVQKSEKMCAKSLAVSGKVCTFAGVNHQNMNNMSHKASKKMLATIARMEKKWGPLEKSFFVEHLECNRIGRGYFDGCTLTSDILQSLRITVAHDGSFSQL